MTDDERTLTPTFQQHYCMPFCKAPCDIKGHMVWHHEEVVRYTPDEMAESERYWAEWRQTMREKGLLP